MSLEDRRESASSVGNMSAPETLGNERHLSSAKDSTLFGKIRKLGTKASLVAMGVTGIGMLAPHEKDTNQEALNQMKSRTPIEQVVGAVQDVMPSIESAEADGGGGFGDVPSNHPYFQAVNYLSAQVNPNTGENIINGYDDGTFKPEREVARQHFAKMIVNALGLAVPEGSSAFRDVPDTGSETKYPDDFIRVAVENDIIKGYDDGTFKPFNNINRAQEVTMIVRALQKFAPGVLRTPSADYQSPFGAFDQTHQDNMDIFYYNSLNKGIVNWNTDPWKAMTRGETSQALYNFIKLKEQPPVGERKLQKLNISLEELKSYGNPAWEKVTGNVSQATQSEWQKYHPGSQVVFEGKDNIPVSGNALNLPGRLIYDLPLDGQGVYRNYVGDPTYAYGKVEGYTEVGGLPYLVLSKEQTGERMAFGLITATIESGKESTFVSSADLRRENPVQQKYAKNLYDMVKNGNIYEFMQKWIKTGDYSIVQLLKDSNLKLVYDQNGQEIAMLATNTHLSDFDSYARSVYGY